MNKQRKWVIAAAILIAFVLPIAYGYLHGKNFAVLDPKGWVASEQRELIIVTVLLGLLVVIPVYILTFVIAWRYRESNKKAKYSPDLDGNTFAELVWWAIPLAIISVLSIITWNSSHALDPRRPLAVKGDPLTIQVVALQWKWLFIYPEEKVASVNRLVLPVGRQVDFDVTADAPMNAFSVPQLGSQIYAMPGMSTKLHLIADQAGSYRGSSANLSGRGFSDMDFVAQAVSASEFKQWVARTQRSTDPLNSKTYQELAKPGPADIASYALTEPELYHSILMKFSEPSH